MRKNKKLLLGGLSVLTLVAAGSGAVSTFAWYAAGAATLNTPTAVDKAHNVTIAANSADGLQYNARLQMTIDHVGTATSLLLSTWNSSSSSLETKIINNVDAVVDDPNVAESAELVAIFKVGIYVEYASLPSSGTVAEWKSLLDGNTKKTTYTFSRDATASASPGSGNTAVETEELLYYFDAKIASVGTTPTAYDHSKEAVSAESEPAGHKFETPTLDTLHDANAFDAEHAYQVGFLYVRIEGSTIGGVAANTGATAHDRDTTYKAFLKAAAPNLA